MTTSILLITPAGDRRVPMNITYYEGEDIVSVSLIYKEREYEGDGCESLAFADLQRQLPDNVLLKCCLSCQHGNMRPYCNGIDLYCMSDTVITSKDDVCDVFYREINTPVLEQRRHDPIDCCGNLIFNVTGCTCITIFITRYDIDFASIYHQ